MRSLAERRNLAFLAGLDEEAHGGAPGLPRLGGYWGSVTPFFGDEAIPSYGCLQTDGGIIQKFLTLSLFYYQFQLSLPFSQFKFSKLIERQLII